MILLTAVKNLTQLCREYFDCCPYFLPFYVLYIVHTIHICFVYFVCNEILVDDLKH